MSTERLKRITVEEGKCGGRPCIRGLRIRVSDILDLLAAGAAYEEILADYPFLEREDILAAIEYAARQADHIVLCDFVKFLVGLSFPIALPNIINCGLPFLGSSMAPCRTRGWRCHSLNTSLFSELKASGIVLT